MNGNWEKVKLKNIFHKVNGLWTGKKEPFVEVKVYTMTNFTKDSLLDKNKEPREILASLAQFEKRRLEKGDILVEKSGGGPKQPVGRAVLFDIENDENNTFSNFTTRLRLTEKYQDKIYPNFVHHYLRLKYIDGETEKFQKNSTNIRNLQLDEYLEQSFSFPPLPEQQRIVSILDECFAAIDQAKANAEKNLQNAKELFESYLRKVFDELALERNQTTLGASCEFFNGKAHEKEIDIAGDYIVVNSKFISSEGDTIKKTANQMFPLFTNDIVMVMSDVPNGKALAKCAIIDVDELYSLNQRICCIRSDYYDTKFLYYQLNRHPYLLAFNNGENQTNLRKGDILNTPLTLPEIEVQRAVASKLDEVKGQAKQLETTYQKKVNDLEELKRSILEKAFKGELVIDTELENT